MVKKTAEYRLNRIKSSNQFRYYISFRDGRNTLCEVEVSREVFQAIETFGKVEQRSISGQCARRKMWSKSAFETGKTKS